MCEDDDSWVRRWLDSFTGISRRDLLTIGASLAGAAAVTTATGRPAAGGRTRRTTALVGGRVLTMDSGDAEHEAVLFDQDRILQVGTRADVLGAAPSGTDVRELRGRTVIPGMIDPHGHFLLAGSRAVLAADLSPAPLGDVATMDDVFTTLRRHRERNPGLPWLIGMGFSDIAIAERRYPDAEELDGLFGDTPVLLMQDSLHVAVVNTAGASALGLDPAGTEQYVPRTGRIYAETAARALNSALPEAGLRTLLKAVDAASRSALSAGVTTAMDAAVTRQLSMLYDILATVPYLSVRLVHWLYETDVDVLREQLSSLGDTSHAWVRPVGVKGFADGSIQGWTAALTQPYHRPPEDGFPDGPRGRLRTDVSGLTDVIAASFEGGLRPAIHANGDAGADAVLEATRRARERTRDVGTAVLMQHCQVLRPDQIASMVDLNVAASVFSRHIGVWGDRHVEVFLGPDRAEVMDPARSLLDAGVSVTLHNDCPVTPLRPFDCMHDAVERRTPSGRVLGSEERITALEALRCFTSSAAEQLGLADRGVVEAGRLPDLTILDADPLTTDLRRIEVEQTWVGGRLRWSRS